MYCTNSRCTFFASVLQDTIFFCSHQRTISSNEKQLLIDRKLLLYWLMLERATLQTQNMGIKGKNKTCDKYCNLSRLVKIRFVLIDRIQCLQNYPCLKNMNFVFRCLICVILSGLCVKYNKNQSKTIKRTRSIKRNNKSLDR